MERKARFARCLKATEIADLVIVLVPDELVVALDQLTPRPTPETTIRGYKVKVSRQALTPGDIAGRRAAIAGVIARSMGTTSTGKHGR